MLEKIGKDRYKSISTPDPIVLKYIDLIKNRSDFPVFFEIGVGIGATTQEVARRLDNKGEIVIFSRAAEVKELVKDLEDIGFHNIDGRWGSPSNVYSGYHFQLAKGFVSGSFKHFDLAYIDGGHVFHLDAPAAAVLKELCKPGGYMLFDDWEWTLGGSPSISPSIRPQTAIEYDEEQIQTCHVQLVCKTIMDTDKRFAFLGIEKDTAIYRRI